MRTRAFTHTQKCVCVRARMHAQNEIVTHNSNRINRKFNAENCRLNRCTPDYPPVHVIYQFYLFEFKTNDSIFRQWFLYVPPWKSVLDAPFVEMALHANWGARKIIQSGHFIVPFEHLSYIPFGFNQISNFECHVISISWQKQFRYDVQTLHSFMIGILFIENVLI